MLFLKAARNTAVEFIREPIQWVETERYLGVTLDIGLTWSAHANQVGKKAAQRLGVLVSLLQKRYAALQAAYPF